jgi:hypothetical protein
MEVNRIDNKRSHSYVAPAQMPKLFYFTFQDRSACGRIDRERRTILLFRVAWLRLDRPLVILGTRLDCMDHSRVTSDLRHMANAGTCASVGAFQGLARFTGVPLVACQWPRSSSPRHTSRGHLKPRQQNKRSGAQPYIRAHAPLPDTPTASYCVHFLKAGLRPITTCGRATYKLT